MEKEETLAFPCTQDRRVAQNHRAVKGARGGGQEETADRFRRQHNDAVPGGAGRHGLKSRGLRQGARVEVEFCGLGLSQHQRQTPHGA